MQRSRIIIIALLALFTVSLPVIAQNNSVTDANTDYTIDLPSKTWRAIARPDEVGQYAEFIYGDRMDGHLRIRKEPFEQNVTAAELATRDQDQKMRFRTGYVEGKQEPFAGRMNGVVTSYEFTRSGRPMSGRVYYLQAPNGTIYTLHFTGTRDSLTRLRNETDAIARSLKTKG